MISVTLQRRMGRYWRAAAESQLLHSIVVWIVFYSDADLFSRISACRHAATDSNMAAQSPCATPSNPEKRAAETRKSQAHCVLLGFRQSQPETIPELLIYSSNYYRINSIRFQLQSIRFSFLLADRIIGKWTDAWQLAIQLSIYLVRY